MPCEQRLEHRRRHEGRRAASEMNLRHRAVAERRHAREIEIQLREHHVHVRRAALVIAGDHRVAAAERAQHLAERQVQVEGKRRRFRRQRRVQGFEPGLGRRCLLPVRHRRIARIPRHRHVVLFEQRRQLTGCSCECLSNGIDKGVDRRFWSARKDTVAQAANPPAPARLVKRHESAARTPTTPGPDRMAAGRATPGRSCPARTPAAAARDSNRGEVPSRVDAEAGPRCVRQRRSELRRVRGLGVIADATGEGASEARAGPAPPLEAKYDGGRSPAAVSRIITTSAPALICMAIAARSSGTAWAAKRRYNSHDDFAIRIGPACDPSIA